MIDLFGRPVAADGGVHTLASFTLMGTAGDDSLTGGDYDDYFHLEDGGEDSAFGGKGPDHIYMGAGFDAGDHIDGGLDSSDGPDVIELDGDYAAGVILDDSNLTGVEVMALAAGHDYRLVFSATPSDGLWNFQASTLGPGDDLTLDASLNSRGVHVEAGAGDDLLLGGARGDELSGAAGADILAGNKGNDGLDGSAGQDVLSGGKGDDTFYFSAPGDSAVGAPDEITDLASHDVINLQGMDANTTKPGDQAFHLIKAFTGHAGQLTLTYDKATHHTLLQGDVDGDGAADFAVVIDGHHKDFSGFWL